MNFFNKRAGKKHNDSVQEKVKNAFTLTITDEFVKIEHPKRETEKILWNDIMEIWMINTDEGPFLPDIWMALVGTDGRCLIPTSDCDGYEQIYDIVSNYENFNYQNVIASACSFSNEIFLLWRKESAVIRSGYAAIRPEPEA